MRKIHFYLLLLLCGVAFGLRIASISSAPPILNRDEAALAYNGLLLSELGVDEFGRTWPLALESFGDFKLPGYPVLLSLLFTFLPATDFVVRLPSVIAGTLLVAAAYALSRSFNWSSRQSLLAALFVAMNPVFIFYSRMAFEANLALTLFVTALSLLFWQSEKYRYHLDGLAVGTIVLAILTYNTPLLLLPMILPVLILWRGVVNWRQWAPVVTVLMVVCVGFISVFAPLTAQKQGITIFSDETILTQYPAYRAQYSLLGETLFGNRYVYYSKLIAARIQASFGFSFLVEQGGAHPWHALPGWGHMFSTMYIAGVVGILVLLLRLWLEFKQASFNVLKWWKLSKVRRLAVVGVLLLIGLAPSVVTVDAPHATRSLFFFVMWMLVTAWVVFEILSWVNQYFSINRDMISLVVGLVLILPVIRYMDTFLVHYPEEQAAALRVGYPAALEQAYDLVEEDELIAVVDPDGYQYILTAWYTKMHPDLFFSTIHRQDPDTIGFKYVDYLDTIHFIADPADQTTEAVLVEWDEAWKVSQR